MPVCRKCKKEYSVWTASIGTSLCKPCIESEKWVNQRAEEVRSRANEKVLYAAKKLQDTPLPPRPVVQEISSPLAMLLRRYIGRNVGINHEDPAKLSQAILSQVTDEYFTIVVPTSELTVTFPLRQILRIVEAEGKVTAGMLLKKEYVVVIEVFHLIVYKGAIGISVPIPIPLPGNDAS